MNSLSAFTLPNFLRKFFDPIPNLDSLLAGLPVSYDLLKSKLESKECPIREKLSLPYFKSLEYNSRIKYYLDKEPKDLDAIMKDVIALMNIPNPEHAYLHDIFKIKIPSYRNFSNWMNFNIITSVRNDSIYYGSIFVTSRFGKFSIILAYGFGDFDVNYNGMNAVFLGRDGDWKYMEIAIAASYSSGDLTDKDSNYMISFMNLEGFKVFGNNYNITLSYPNLDSN